MSQQNVLTFFATATSDPSRQTEIARIFGESTPRDAKAAALAELSQKSDTPFTAEDALAVQAARSSIELSDADLDGVAGGRGVKQPSSGKEPGLEKR